MQPLVNHTGGILAMVRAQLSQRAYEEAADRDAAEQADAERTAAERTAVERVTAECAAVERVTAEHTAVERVAAEWAAAERVTAEWAAVQRAAAEWAAIEDDGEYPTQLLILITDVQDEYKVLWQSQTKNHWMHPHCRMALTWPTATTIPTEKLRRTRIMRGYTHVSLRTEQLMQQSINRIPSLQRREVE